MKVSTTLHKELECHKEDDNPNNTYTASMIKGDKIAADCGCLSQLCSHCCIRNGLASLLLWMKSSMTSFSFGVSKKDHNLVIPNLFEKSHLSIRFCTRWHVAVVPPFYYAYIHHMKIILHKYYFVFLVSTTKLKIYLPQTLPATVIRLFSS